MSTKKMNIRIARNGHTEIRVEGGQGDNCLAFTQAIEKALGNLEQRELTEDYHATDPLVVNHQETLKEYEML